MNEKYLTMLDFDKVLTLLSNETSIDASADFVMKITPSADIEVVKALMKNTEDAYSLSAQYASPSFGRISDAKRIFEILSVSGNLNIKDFLAFSEILRVIRTVKEWKENCSGKTSLDTYFDSLIPNKYFEDKINFCIKDEETLNDNASSELYEIRRKISSATQNIRSRLDKIVKNGAKNKYLQDAIVTQRDGRFVVPVKAEYKSEISGVVHDSSATGATLFVEPMPIVEINNELRVLRAKEIEEIDRILNQLSLEASNFYDSAFASYNSLIKIDIVFAKASLAYKMKASVPNINDCGKIYLKNARHPLINKNKVVPITVELGNDFDTLVVTGPNTGGKTVSLKTVGLLTIMAMCGLMIPVDDNSSVSVFDNILVDIGDEQSIEQSLSTFSAHMVNIISMLNVADYKSLVLIDELGAGTDPTEGAALAKAILIDFADKGAKIFATTHYPELKEYAINTDRVENASCEFDVETLKPTFRFLIGVPGSSNAFAISSRLGLDDRIIATAKGYLTDEKIKFESLASALDKARKDTENDRKEVSDLKAELYEKKRIIDSQLNDLNTKREKIINKAREDSVRLIDDTRVKANILLNNLEEIKKELNKENSNEKLSLARQSVKSSISDLENSADPVELDDGDYELPRSLEISDKVILADIKKEGTVLEIKDNKVYVAIGNLKIWTDIENIRLNEKKTREIPKTRTVSKSLSKSVSSFKSEIDIRGMNSEEGILAVDKYLDDAFLSSVKTVTIIHGKGTGVLRKSIHSYLKSRKGVESFRLGTFGEGEMGVTVVTLSDL